MQNIFGNYGAQPDNSTMPNQGVAPQPQIDENVDVPSQPSYPSYPMYQMPPLQYDNEPTPALDTYRDLLNKYPDRPKPSIMRMIGTGALSYVNADQPDQVTETIGPGGKVTKTIKKGIWKPYDINETKKIMDMPYEQELGDYGNKLKTAQAAASIEQKDRADRALTAQRYGSAAKSVASIPQTQQKIDISADRARIAGMNAETRARAQALQEKIKDLPDSERLRLVQEGQIDLEDLRNAGAMERVQAQQAGATHRTEMQQSGATQRERESQAAATGRTEMQQTGANQRQEDKQDTGQLPSQQKVRMQLRATQAVREHPEWKNYVTIDSNGMVQVKPVGGGGFFGGGLDEDTRKQIVDYLNGTGISAVAPPPEVSQSKPPAKPTKLTNKKPTSPPNTSHGMIQMYAPDGKSFRMVPQDKVQIAIEQGYSYK